MNLIKVFKFHVSFCKLLINSQTFMDALAHTMTFWVMISYWSVRSKNPQDYHLNNTALPVTVECSKSFRKLRKFWNGSAEFDFVTGSEVPKILIKTGLHCYWSIQLCSHGIKYGKYSLRKIRGLATSIWGKCFASFANLVTSLKTTFY
jgi:hypothetical protein